MAASDIWYSVFTDPVITTALNREAELLLGDREFLFNHPALVYSGNHTGIGSTARKTPLFALDGVNELAAVNEGSGPSASTLGSAAPAVTVARQAAYYRISDLFRSVDATGLNPTRIATSLLGETLARLTTMIAALMGGFSNAVGSSGVDMDVDDWYEAQATLSVNSVPGPYIAVLHPRQYEDWKQSLLTQGGLTQFRAASADQMAMRGPGYKGSYDGVDIFTTTRVPLDGGSANRLGGMFGRGAIHWADARIPLIGNGVPQIDLGLTVVTYDYDAKPGDLDVVGASMLGAAEREDLRGVEIATDA